MIMNVVVSYYINIDTMIEIADMKGGTIKYQI